MLDYKELGVKVGLEFHQMLDTRGKLFCNCPPEIIRGHEEPTSKVIRQLRPTTSEIGEIDPAALFEFKRGRKYEYEYFNNTSCLVELDEEPPHDLNEEALEITLLIALMLGSTPVDEVQVMRKIVIDGSNTTGFQRTALVALGGNVKVGEKTIPIQTICLEEDASRKISEDFKTVTYRLDRLGIPLIEIATAPVISSPKEAEEVALKIGQLLRITGRVKRGLGTIRQDINVSIRGGAKIEIKGIQKLELIAKVVEYEVQRQYNLLKIRDELKKRNIKEEDLVFNPIDVSNIFINTKSKVIKKQLERGGKVFALKVPGFKGIFGWKIQPNRRFGTEVADRARFWGGVKGIFHSDELPAYGISLEEIEKVKKILEVSEMDAFILVAEKEEKALEALKASLERCKEALKGVPEETRGPNPDGTTRYMRPRPGAARMYPETDIRPFRITEELISKLRENIPPPPEKLFEKFVKEYGLSKQLASQVLRSHYLDLFLKITESFPRISPTVIASTLTNTLINLKREGVNIENLKEKHFIELFKLLDREIIVKDAIPKILEYLSNNPEENAENAVKVLALTKINEKELKLLIDEVVTKLLNAGVKKEKLMKLAMKEIMERVRGRVEGKKVARLLRERIS